MERLYKVWVIVIFLIRDNNINYRNNNVEIKI